MKIFKFSLRDCPEDATDFYYQVLAASKNAGFFLPDKELKRKLGKKFRRYDVVEYLAKTWGRASLISNQGGTIYVSDDLMDYSMCDVEEKASRPCGT